MDASWFLLCCWVFTQDLSIKACLLSLLNWCLLSIAYWGLNLIQKVSINGVFTNDLWNKFSFFYKVKWRFAHCQFIEKASKLPPVWYLIKYSLFEELWRHILQSTKLSVLYVTIVFYVFSIFVRLFIKRYIFEYLSLGREIWDSKIAQFRITFSIDHHVLSFQTIEIVIQKDSKITYSLYTMPSSWSRDKPNTILAA